MAWGDSLNTILKKELHPKDIPLEKRQRTEGIWIGKSIDAKVEFFTEDAPFEGGIRKGGPGFYLWNGGNAIYEVYIKGVDPKSFFIGEKYSLIITKFDKNKKVIYVEPMLVVGNEIYAEIKYKTGIGEYGFRFFSYDGFVTTKDIQIDGCYKIRITDEWIKPTIKKEGHNGFRIGILKGIALEEVPKDLYDYAKDKIFRVAVPNGMTKSDLDLYLSTQRLLKEKEIILNGIDRLYQPKKS